MARAGVPASKKEEVLTEAAARKRLEDVRRDVSLSQEDEAYPTPLMGGGPWSRLMRGGRKQWGGCQGLEEERSESECLLGTEFRFFKMKKFWRSAVQQWEWQIVCVFFHN